jgi:hypothetical protein
LNFGVKPDPDVLLIFLVFFEEQPEGFFSTELSDASEVFDPEAIQNLGSLQVAFAQAQWAFNGFVRRRDDGCFVGQHNLRDESQISGETCLV